MPRRYVFPNYFSCSVFAFPFLTGYSATLGPPTRWTRNVDRYGVTAEVQSRLVLIQCRVNANKRCCRPAALAIGEASLVNETEKDGRGRLFDVMNIISLNVGLPRIVDWNGEPVTTGIFKEPVQGPIMLRTLNLDGDGQADLTVHGGISKAVYAYPVEHYEFWRKTLPADYLPNMDLPYGMFGENLSTAGLFEDSVNVGDRFRIGQAQVIVTEPRLPCYKLGIKFGRSDIIKKFLQSRRTGFYFAVTKEGEVQAGDDIELISRDASNITISDITRLYAFERDDLATLRRAVKLEALSQSWREYFEHQIQKVIS